VEGRGLSSHRCRGSDDGPVDNCLLRGCALLTKVCIVTDAHHTFGANLRRARRRRGLSQERLGEIADVHRTSISNIERGRTDPGAMLVARLLIALEITGGPLFEGVVPRAHAPR
jgi:DNA-binding XRE family transcriptional regulator